MGDLVTFPLPTDTVHTRIESRQYKLFNIDLGEGIIRRHIAVGAAIVIPYWFLLAKVFGLSVLWHSGQGGFIYMFPAGLMVWFALQSDEGGRARYVAWLDRGRFLLRRRQPMIAGTISRPQPGKAFLVSVRWSGVDVGASKRLRRTMRALDALDTGFDPVTV